jgi:hypothetical protein
MVNPMMLAINEVPPWLKKGRLTPLLGSMPETTPRLRKACKDIKKVIAIAT